MIFPFSPIVWKKNGENLYTPKLFCKWIMFIISLKRFSFIKIKKSSLACFSSLKRLLGIPRCYAFLLEIISSHRIFKNNFVETVLHIKITTNNSKLQFFFFVYWIYCVINIDESLEKDFKICLAFWIGVLESLLIWYNFPTIFRTMKVYLYIFNLLAHISMWTL